MRSLPAVLIVGAATVVLALTVRPISLEPAWAVAGGRFVALTLLTAGGTLWFAGARPAAVAAAFAGLFWAGVIWSIERVTGADPLVGAGMLLAPFLAPSLALLVLALPGLWRMHQQLASMLVVGSAVVGVAGIARVLVYEPILDLHCGLFCGHSPVLVVADLRLAAWLGGVAAAASVAVCGTIALGILFARPARTRVAGRDIPPRILAASGIAALGAASLAGVVQGAIGATTEDLVRVVGLRAVACMAISGAAILVAAERLSIGRNLTQIARLLAEEGNRPTAEALLRDALRDPSLSVGYAAGERGYVGTDGQPLDLTAAGRQRTELTRRGRTFAVILNDRALPSDLVEAHIGPEARLAIQNESLELELERTVDQLRASRRRVVEAGDAARRQLERDLHDGAQQLLLALSFEVRRGERSAVEHGDDTSAALFAEVRGVAGRILEQLRGLAHGIHPTILTNAGLEPALATYAGSMDSPPSVTVELPRRLPADCEASVYAIVTALVDSAPHGSRNAYSIQPERDDVRIVVHGDLDVPNLVLDRVGAAGGRYMADEAGLEFVLPCA